MKKIKDAEPGCNYFTIKYQSRIPSLLFVCYIRLSLAIFAFLVVVGSCDSLGIGEESEEGKAQYLA